MTQRGIEPGAFLLCQDESLRKTISPKEDWRTGRLDSSKAGGLERAGAGGLEGWLEGWRAAVSLEGWRAGGLERLQSGGLAGWQAGGLEGLEG